MKVNRSRTALSVLNILSGFANRFLVSILKLLGRVVFFRYLSAELYGVSGLFSNVLGLLALAELGIGTAITFSLYTPLAENDREKLKTLMAFYKKAYRIIALAVTVLGLGLMPFLPHLIRDYQGIDHFYLIYLIFLANMVIDYFFSYKRTLATAAQEGYRLVPFTTGFELAVCILQILVIVLLHRSPYCFLIYLAVQTLCIFIQNLVINRYLDRHYPILLDKKNVLPLGEAEKKSILTNVKALMYHKIGSVVVAGTDNLLISRLVDLVTVGLYSNYATMISTVSGLVYLFVGNTTASFGNLIAKEPPKKRLEVFEELQFFYFALYGICTAFFITLFQPFIAWAYGEEFSLSLPVVLLVVVANFYLLGLTYVLDVVKSAAGLYDRDKWVPMAQAAVNLGISILLGLRIGLAGIFWGTLLSTLIPLFVKPVIIYRDVFEKSPLSYFLTLLYEIVTTAILCGASLGLGLLIPIEGALPQLLVRFAVTGVVSVGLFFLFHFKSPHLPSLMGRVKKLLFRKG